MQRALVTLKAIIARDALIKYAGKTLKKHIVIDNPNVSQLAHVFR
jgi:hypothetical protein